MLISIRMKKDLQRIIEIPEGVQVEINKNIIVVKSGGKELIRDFDFGKVKVEKTEKELKLSVNGASRNESRMIGTIWAHLKNMLAGVGEDYVYKLEIANVHFPMSVKVDGANKQVVIKSFLGEAADRFSKIVEGVKVEVNGENIIVSSHDKEKAGQTAANLEKAARLTGRDRRIFQDGIYITEKPGRVI